MSEQFRTCLFGGFAKDDVVKFIARQAEENKKLTDALREKAEALEAQNTQLEEALRKLHGKAAVLQEGSESAAEWEERCREAEQQAAALREENEALRGPAQAYAQVKDHIAEIEISAHRRTEEFRAEAIAKLRQCIAQQRDWCNEQRGRYEGMNEDTLQTLRRCQQIVENNDSQAFERMLLRLQELEDTLE